MCLNYAKNAHFSTFVAEFEIPGRASDGRETGTSLSIIIGARACPASLILPAYCDYDENISTKKVFRDAAEPIDRAFISRHYNIFYADRYVVKTEKIGNIEKMRKLFDLNGAIPTTVLIGSGRVKIFCAFVLRFGGVSIILTTSSLRSAARFGDRVERSAPGETVF